MTSDVALFWEAFDRFKETNDPASLQELYLDRGSVGLDGYMDHRIVGADELAATIQANIAYYRSIREPLQDIGLQEQAILAVFESLRNHCPKAVFPDVYFVIGRMNSGGTTSRHGLVIGAEMYGLTDTYPRDSLSAWHRSVLRPPS